MIYAIIITLTSLILSFVITKKIYAPATIVSALWLFCVIAYNIYPHPLFPLKTQFYISISIWVGLFTLSSLFVDSLYQTPNNTHNPNKSFRNLYLILSVITFVYTFTFITNLLKELGLTDNIFLNLRNLALGNFKELEEGTSNNYFAPLWIVSYIIELLHFERKRILPLIILMLINIGWGILIMSKLTFLGLFISTFIILLYKNKLKTKTILISLAALFIFFTYFQVLRSSRSELEGKKLNYDFFTLYVLAGMPAYETVEPNSSNYYGENTLRFFYALTYKTGISNKKPANPILKFIDVNTHKHEQTRTNVYTTLYPYFKDFGYGGIVFFAILIGAFYGYIYKKSKKGNNPMIISYAILASSLVLQFMNEMTITTLSYLIQVLILSHIPYWINKTFTIKIKEKKERNS